MFKWGKKNNNKVKNLIKIGKFIPHNILYFALFYLNFLIIFFKP